MRIACLAVLLVSVVGCDAPTATVAAQAPAPAGEPMQPLRPRPPAPPVAPAPPPPAFPDQVLVAGQRRLGWHRFPSSRVVDGPWTISGVLAEPGDQTISFLGHSIDGCRVTPVRGGEATWCPGIGVVARVGREGDWYVDESVVAIRRGDETWASSPCDVMHFIDDAARAGLCDARTRTLGAGPIPGRVEPSCRWEYTPDGPSTGRRRAVVTVRLSRDVQALDDWAAATRASSRTWAERRGGWAAAVRIERGACGGAEGAAFAERLVALAPESSVGPGVERSL